MTIPTILHGSMMIFQIIFTIFFIFTIYWKSFKSQIPYKTEKWSYILYQTIVNDPEIPGLLRLTKSLNYHIIFTMKQLESRKWERSLVFQFCLFSITHTSRYAQAIIRFITVTTITHQNDIFLVFISHNSNIFSFMLCYSIADLPERRPAFQK